MTDPRTHNQRIEDQLEEAWLAGEISHAEACAELDELDDRP
jgi:hypothetical protein